MAKRGNVTDELDNETIAELEAEVASETNEAVDADATADGTEPIDIEPFTTLVDSLIEDGSEDYSAATELFRSLDRRNKSAVTRWFTSESRSAMKPPTNFPRAQTLIMIEEAVKTPVASAPRAAKEPANPTEAFVNKLATLKLAFALAEASAPEGVDEDYADKVNAIVTEGFDAANSITAFGELSEAEQAEYEAPVASDVVADAMKLAAKGKRVAGSGTGTRGPRHDVGAHIDEAMENVASGEFVAIKDLAAFNSEAYGDGEGSTGPASISAVTAKLKSEKFNPEGYAVAELDGKLGLLKD